MSELAFDDVGSGDPLVFLGTSAEMSPGDPAALLRAGLVGVSAPYLGLFGGAPRTPSGSYRR